MQSFPCINQSLQTAKNFRKLSQINKKKDEICFNALPVLNEFNVSVLTLFLCVAPVASYNMCCTCSKLQYVLHLWQVTICAAPFASYNMCCTCSKLQYVLHLWQVTICAAPVASYNKLLSGWQIHLWQVTICFAPVASYNKLLSGWQIHLWQVTICAVPVASYNMCCTCGKLQYVLHLWQVTLCAAPVASYNKLLPGWQMNMAVKIDACFEDRLLLHHQDLSVFRTTTTGTEWVSESSFDTWTT